MDLIDQEKVSVVINNRKNFWNKKVLYIYPMRGETYFVINQGIIEGLRTMVSELYTANFDQDVVELSAKIMPDLLLVLLGDAFPIEKVLAIRSMGIKTAVWFTDDPYYTDVTSRYCPILSLCFYPRDKLCILLSIYWDVLKCIIYLLLSIQKFLLISKTRRKMKNV